MVFYSVKMANSLNLCSNNIKIHLHKFEFKTFVICHFLKLLVRISGWI